MFPADLIKPSTYWLPLTYPPKIPGVIAGTIRQTIRVTKKTHYCVGDRVAFHGWAGKPYRSPWSFRTELLPLEWVRDVDVLPKGIIATFFKEEAPLSEDTYARCTLWLWEELDWLAALDGIDPPTGIELGRVLCEYNDVPESGAPGQIIRW
jgi:hypothetical protein